MTNEVSDEAVAYIMAVADAIEATATQAPPQIAMAALVMATARLLHEMNSAAMLSGHGSVRDVFMRQIGEHLKLMDEWESRQ